MKHLLLLLLISLTFATSCTNFEITQMELLSVYACIDKCKLTLNDNESKANIEPNPECLENTCGELYEK